MARKKNLGKSTPTEAGIGPQKKSATSNLLDRLSPEESSTVLRLLLEQNPTMRATAQKIAEDLVSSPSIEDIASEVHQLITSVDLEALNERAGAHSWGYVEPSEAACELLEESLADLVNDLKRRAECGFIPAAETICAGIVQGLYQAKDVDSDGALGWATDFPAEHACQVVTEFLQSCKPSMNKSDRDRIVTTIASLAPDWDPKSVVNFNTLRA
jgi:hypothetical protein